MSSVDVLYIGGFTRSGSTLVAALLGSLPGYVAVGEARELWQKGVRDNHLCNCGVRFHECPFWSRVGQVAFGGWSGVDPEKLGRIADELLTSDRYLLGLLGHRRLLGRRGADLHRQYTEAVSAVYRAVAEVSGASVVVDSSKLPSGAFALARAPGVQLRVLQLVRDSRGVVFSWSKRDVVRPDAADNMSYMNSYGVAFTAVRWVFYNLLLDVTLLRRIPAAFATYEATVQDAEAEVSAALRRLGLPTDRLALAGLGKRGLALSSMHMVGGNPMRFHGDSQSVVVDDGWRDGLSRRDRRLVELLTWPLLLRYGYRLNEPSMTERKPGKRRWPRGEQQRG